MCFVCDHRFSINGLSTKKLPSITKTPTLYKIKVKNCKLIELVIRIELTPAILMPWFSKFLLNSTIHFCMFLYLLVCFPRVTVSLLCTSCMKDTCSNLPLSNLWSMTRLFDLVTDSSTKPRFSGNMQPNITTCDNGWSNLDGRMDGQNCSPNQSIYSYLL